MGKNRSKENVIKHGDLAGFLAEFQKESDRAASVLGAAYLDESLGQLLAASLIEDSREVAALVETGTPLGSFSSRMRAAYCMGLISRDEYDDLTRIGAIRNRFAHDLQGLNFSDDWAVKVCDALQQPEEALKLLETLPGVRNRFNVAVAILVMALGLRIDMRRNKKRPSVAQGFTLVETVK